MGWKGADNFKITVLCDQWNFFYHGYGVEGSVSADTEVWARDIVGDGRRNNNKWNT